MLLAGDELGRTQRGNNNAYCQDNEISWLDWRTDAEKENFVEFVRRLLCLRREHHVFRRRKFLEGRPIHGEGIKDIVWLNPDGREMSDEEWSQHFARCLGVYLSGADLDEVDDQGNPVQDDDFLLVVNAHHEDISFRLPETAREDDWLCVLDTAFEQGLATDGRFPPGREYLLQGRSLVLFSRPRPQEAVLCALRIGRGRR